MADYTSSKSGAEIDAALSKAEDLPAIAGGDAAKAVLVKSDESGYEHTTVATASHTHDTRYYTEAEIDSSLSGKADSSHSHAESDITDLETHLAARLENLSEDTTPQLGGSLDTNSKQVQWSKGADIASGTALPLIADGNYFDVTGTTTIATIDTTGRIGTVIKLHFDGALTLTHSADLVLPGAEDITTVAGDEAEFIEYASGDWRCTNYQTPSTPGSLVFISELVASNDASVDFDSDIDDTYDEYEIHFYNAIPATDAVEFWFRTSTDGGTSYDSAFENYAYDEVGGGNGKDTKIPLTSGDNIGSGSNEYGCTGILKLFEPSHSGYTEMFATLNYAKSDGDFLITTIGGRRTSVADVDAVRFLFSSGNIESGTFRLYGIKKS